MPLKKLFNTRILNFLSTAYDAVLWYIVDNNTEKRTHTAINETRFVGYDRFQYDSLDREVLQFCEM